MENKIINIKWGEKEYTCVVEHQPPRFDEYTHIERWQGEIKEIRLEIYYHEDSKDPKYKEYFEKENNFRPDRDRCGWHTFLDLEDLFGQGDYYRIGLISEGIGFMDVQDAVDSVREELIRKYNILGGIITPIELTGDE
jgi:hypothetical protein